MAEQPGPASAEWTTHARAAAIVGCSPRTIDRKQRDGTIARRHTADRKLPSLSLASVEAFAEQWKREQAEKQQRIPKHLLEYGPPNDGDVWLNTTTAALVVGVTPQYLTRLAAQERIPSTRKNGRRRLWFRRRDVEQFAAVRALLSRLDDDHRLPA